uniref:Oxidation resistance protein 1 n=1 Tax=Chromera velia CCMP2878 TaxID=1169474 RepID=A0A0G4G4Y1_9ALVE|eukprot:Cvel_4168.t1-p1 / transcript=Cvel_4168.t1 / gene=Cvel_4168 / organism=Chromera_velia_CCMP2878 / gene_product=hypothetical protein / transcript_product=hypothetical protein / location=Cvel_scaffold179:76953-78659(+) / protein_length=569 / sequence_SO=supercontig / SO=protein_coding / is_pseudo=false
MPVEIRSCDQGLTQATQVECGALEILPVSCMVCVSLFLDESCCAHLLACCRHLYVNFVEDLGDQRHSSAKDRVRGNGESLEEEVQRLNESVFFWRERFSCLYSAKWHCSRMPCGWTRSQVKEQQSRGKVRQEAASLSRLGTSKVTRAESESAFANDMMLTRSSLREACFFWRSCCIISHLRTCRACGMKNVHEKTDRFGRVVCTNLTSPPCRRLQSVLCRDLQLYRGTIDRIKKSELIVLQPFLPPNVQVQRLALVFSTQRHGWSMTSLCRRVTEEEEEFGSHGMLLVVRQQLPTLGGKPSAPFGAWLPILWSSGERSSYSNRVLGRGGQQRSGSVGGGSGEGPSGEFQRGSRGSRHGVWGGKDLTALVGAFVFSCTETETGDEQMGGETGGPGKQGVRVWPLRESFVFPPESGYQTRREAPMPMSAGRDSQSVLHLSASSGVSVGGPSSSCSCLSIDRDFNGSSFPSQTFSNQRSLSVSPIFSVYSLEIWTFRDSAELRYSRGARYSESGREGAVESGDLELLERGGYRALQDILEHNREGQRSVARNLFVPLMRPLHVDLGMMQRGE